MSPQPPALPAGYKIDATPTQAGGAPPLPAGYKLVSGGATPPADRVSGQFGIDHPILAAPVDLIQGIGAGVMSTVRGASQLAHKVIPAIPELPAGYAQPPDSNMAKVGKFAEQAAEFAAPMGAVSKATKGMGLLARMGAEGVAAGGVSALQSGGDPGATAAGAVAGAAGPAVGAAVGAAGKAIAESSIPKKLYQGALKPTWAMAKKDGLEMLDTGLREQIPVSDKGLTLIGEKIKDLQEKITAGVESRTRLGSSVSSTKVLDALKDLKQFYADTPVPGGTVQTGVKQVPKAGLLDAAGKPIMENVPVNETVKGPLQILNDLETQFKQFHGERISLDQAQQIKINTYQLIKDSYGEMASAKIEGLKRVALGLKDQISEVFPEIADLNEAQSKLLGLDEAMTRAVWRIENHQAIGIGSPLAASAGHAALGGPGAAAGFMGKMLIDNPMLKSKLAIALSKAGVENPAGVISARMAALKATMGKSASSFVDSHNAPSGQLAPVLQPQ